MEQNPVSWNTVSWHEANKIPAEPGCYALLDNNNSILYIGRSKILWNRLRNPSKHSAFKKVDLNPDNLKIAWNSGWDVYDSERTLILQWRPPLCQERIRWKG